MMSELVLSIRDLRVTFDTPLGPLEAVRGVDLDVHCLLYTSPSPRD